VPSDLTALYAAIMANPDDDTVRLIYADELQALGQEDYAEFIRVQVEIFRHATSCQKDFDRLKALEARETELKATPEMIEVSHNITRVMGFDPEAYPDSFMRLLGGVQWSWERDFIGKVKMPYEPTNLFQLGGTPMGPEVMAARFMCYQGWARMAHDLLLKLPINSVELTTRPQIEVVNDRTNDVTEQRNAKNELVLLRKWTIADNTDMINGNPSMHHFYNKLVINRRELHALKSGDRGYFREEFDKKCEHYQSVRGYLGLRWPSIKTWKLPPTVAVGDPPVHYEEGVMPAEAFGPWPEPYE